MYIVTDTHGNDVAKDLAGANVSSELIDRSEKTPTGVANILFKRKGDAIADMCIAKGANEEFSPDLVKDAFKRLEAKCERGFGLEKILALADEEQPCRLCV